jgi:hypothetical protein
MPAAHLVFGGRPATMYFSGSRLALVRDGTPTLVVSPPEATKERIIALLGRVRRIG